ILNTKINCTLTHIGEDFHQGEIQKKVIEMGLTDKVKFVGLIANDKLPEYYHDADILLHTSLYESQAVVVNEAMASGLLVCGTRVGLLADLTDTCCLTVNPGDAEGLAEIVLRLISDTSMISKIRKNAYEWSTAHDLKWTVQQHRAVYELTSDKRGINNLK
ncbi:MAG TPA: glycosyltransferase family 4 protein, partial [Cyclobacteriaceae bacterium]